MRVGFELGWILILDGMVWGCLGVPAAAGGV